MVSFGALLHPLIEEVLATSRTVLPDGSSVIADSFITRDECELLYEVVARIGATSAIEVGMAYGVSTLCIADALKRAADAATTSPRLVSIDPAQGWGWHYGGVHLLRRAGYEGFTQLIEEKSQLALPRLVSTGERFAFGFIDGWHTFDHTLIDFFFIDMLLHDGGVIVFDDVGYPAINAVVRFILANRDYELFAALPIPEPLPSVIRFSRAVKRVARPLARTDRDPSSAHARLFRAIEHHHSVALRKRGADTRRFDHFERF